MTTCKKCGNKFIHGDFDDGETCPICKLEIPKYTHQFNVDEKDPRKSSKIIHELIEKLNVLTQERDEYKKQFETLFDFMCDEMDWHPNEINHILKEYPNKKGANMKTPLEFIRAWDKKFGESWSADTNQIIKIMEQYADQLKQEFPKLKIKDRVECECGKTFSFYREGVCGYCQHCGTMYDPTNASWHHPSVQKHEYESNGTKVEFKYETPTYTKVEHDEKEEFVSQLDIKNGDKLYFFSVRDGVKITRINRRFNAVELLGYIEYLKKEIIDQMIGILKADKVQVERKVIKEPEE